MLQWGYFLLFLTLVITTHQNELLEGFKQHFLAETKHMRQEPPDRPKLDSKYDFIIVGAGTAGCVVANRLSENPKWKVLLIEAGGAENYFMDMPILVNYLQMTTANWNYKTVPNKKFCQGMDNQQCKWPRGKVMGGSSILNYMIYTRGNRRDYDHWANLGNPGWSFDEVLPYFKKIENFTVSDAPDTSYHNKNGYVNINYSPFKSGITDAFIEASKQYGLPYVDYNGPLQVGVSRMQLNMRDGVRESSSRAYLHPIRDRPNLHVKKEATVSKILIDPKTKKTQGVEFYKHGKKHVVRTKKEVILSAGAINSPQLLMLSGIGPKKHLKEKGIQVIANLKVGYNLMDHVAIGGITFVIDKPYSINIEDVITPEYFKDYLLQRRGPLSSPGGCEVLVFQDLKNPTDPDGYPDIELFLEAASIASEPLVRKNFGIAEAIYDAVYRPIEVKHTFMVFPMLLRPKSKGRIKLKDNRYTSKPEIYPNYFAFDEDMDTIIGGVRLLLNITKQPAMRKIGTRLHDIPIPGCAKFDFGTDDYFRCMARHFSFTIYHLSGTCKMGPASDTTAVVDSRLRVHGIKGLRVIDASVMPEVPAAHTNAPTFMIAEKGSDMIKEDWHKKN